MMDYPKDYKISRLIAKKVIGTLSPAEEERLEAWLKEDVRNRELFQYILEGKNLSSRDLYARHFEVDDSWKTVKKQLGVTKQTKKYVFWEDGYCSFYNFTCRDWVVLGIF